MAKPDPRKLKDEAQEAVARGKWKKALECYQQLEKLEPREGTWSQKAGEMARKLGQKAEAAAALMRAAETFSATGFLLKAIACCKVILEIDPGHTDTQSKLAALHSQRGAHAAAPTQAVAALPMSRQAAPVPAPRPAPAPAPAPAPVAKPAPAPAPAPAEPLIDLELEVETPPPAPPPRPATPDITRADPPPRTRSLPPNMAALDQVSLGKVMPGARRSQEISVVTEAAAYEIPLDDSLDAAFGALATETGPAPTDAAPAPPSVGEIVARDVFPRTPLFSSLDERRLRALIERVRLVHLEPGDAVFEKGDPGDALYVVAEGEVAVLAGDEGVEVARLDEGAFFGEIALVARQPRNATVAATMPTDLLAIDAPVLFELAEDEPEVLRVVLRFLRDRLLALLVETSPLFAPFTGAERQALAGRFRFIEAEPGATLVEQGKRTPGLFCLLSGTVRVAFDGKPVADLGPGELFGEMSLLSSGPAAATITAAVTCYLMELPRADFTELIMTHPQVLEHLSAVADERARLLGEFKAGRATYREGRLRML